MDWLPGYEIIEIPRIKHYKKNKFFVKKVTLSLEDDEVTFSLEEDDEIIVDFNEETIKFQVIWEYIKWQLKSILVYKLYVNY